MNMKRTILTAVIMLWMALYACPAFASVEEKADKGVAYDIIYPVVHTDNKSAQDKINQDIYSHVESLMEGHNAGKYVKSRMRYEVKYEDDSLLSLKLNIGVWLGIGARPTGSCLGLVYDKKTGKRLPLSHFLKITLEQLCAGYRDHVYDSKGKVIRSEDGKRPYKPSKVSEEYYLLGNGGIALLYPPYALSWRADGDTTIRFNAQEVDYFNRKNRAQ